MSFQEIAAGAIGGVAVGCHLAGGSGRRSAHIDCQAGIEARFLAEVGHAVIGLKREDANELVLTLVEKYEKTLANNMAPVGKKFQECYDTKRITMTDECLEIYKEAKEELKEIGVDLD